MRNLPNSEKQAALQSMRKKVIALLMNWKPDLFGLWDAIHMRYLPDMTKIYEWVNTYGHLKPKWLNKYSYDELTVLVSQVKKITSSSKNGQQKQKQKPKRRDQTDTRSPAQGGAQGDRLLPGADRAKLSHQPGPDLPDPGGGVPARSLGESKPVLH